jgi:hypothetical protein
MSFSLPERVFDAGMIVANPKATSRTWKGHSSMKKLFSLVFGSALLIGAATLGLPSGSASAANHRHKHHKHHHKHQHHNRYHKNKLSY